MGSAPLDLLIVPPVPGVRQATNFRKVVPLANDIGGRHDSAQGTWRGFFCAARASEGLRGFGQATMPVTDFSGGRRSVRRRPRMSVASYSGEIMQEFNTHERDLILEGLRFVRSARKLEFRPATAKPDPKRVADLEAIAELLSRLDGSGERATVTADR